ncbi:hypothetical protein BGX20_006005, partial [Mortierella sp. AD010]
MLQLQEQQSYEHQQQDIKLTRVFCVKPQLSPYNVEDKVRFSVDSSSSVDTPTSPASAASPMTLPQVCTALELSHTFACAISDIAQAKRTREEDLNRSLYTIPSADSDSERPRKRPRKRTRETPSDLL